MKPLRHRRATVGSRSLRGLGFAMLLACLTACGAEQSRADPDIWRNYGWARTDFSKTSVDLKEIRMGIQVLPGMSTKDRIPAIDDPEFQSIEANYELGDDSPVITLDINGDARAYPLAVLTWHEIVNDTVGGVPVAVTYCPLCNTALVFDRRIGDMTYDFGTSGMLRHSDLVMYDRQTDSWWQQFTGEAIVGSMTGTSLKGVPARLEAFRLFRLRYPEGKVLVPNDPSERVYGRNPYVGYDTSSRPFLYTGAMPEGIEPMARVIMVNVDGRAEALPLDVLKETGKRKLGDIMLTWTAGQNSALDTARIDDGRDVGNIVAQRTSDSGVEDVVYHVTFAFAFHAFHPHGTLHLE